MSNNAKVTIIIPAYNVEEYIYKGIESCIEQTYDNLEIIIVDDGSTDNTASIIEQYSKLDPRIIFIRQENAGVSSARNNALNHTTGKYVIFLDSDDWLELTAVEQLIANSDGENFIICSRYIVDELNTNLRVNDDIRKKIEIVEGEKILESFLNKYYYFQSSCYKLFDVEIINNNHLRFSEEISHGEDGLFVFQYLQFVNKLISVPIPLWNILNRSNSASNSSFSLQKLTAIRAAESMLTFNLSQPVHDLIIRYIVIRAETMYLEACLSEDDNSEAIRTIKMELIKYKEILTYSQTTLREKIRFYVITYFPAFFVNKLIRLKNIRVR